jgi:hypothetical protein
MAARELTVVVLNHTNEELGLEPASTILDHGQWVDEPEWYPTQLILAGESGLWRCESRHFGSNIEGSVTYRILHETANRKVTFKWNIHYVGTNKFDHTCTMDEFGVRAFGGSGRHAVAVFVFGSSKLRAGKYVRGANRVETEPVKR